MKLSVLNLSLLFISFSCICGTCSKNDDAAATPPIQLQYSKGFLTSIGVNGLGDVDSVCLRFGQDHPVSEYNQVAVDNGWLERARYSWEIIKTGNNQWQIKFNDGRYLGYKYTENPVYERNRYTASIDLTPNENNLFVMNQSNNMFYIQPAANKNVYLNTVVSTAVPASPRHSFVRFVEGKQQMWFIMP
jgi:hypothetical protein